MANTEYNTIIHPIPPFYDRSSKILILGSFPSIKTREYGFFYGHKQNRFWRVLSVVFDEEIIDDIERKKEFLLKHNIALWDSIYSCDIIGSSDSSIKNVVATDLSPIVSGSYVNKIFCNGTTSYKYFHQLSEKKLGINGIRLPSTSPANASYSLERLIDEWRIVAK